MSLKITRTVGSMLVIEKLATYAFYPIHIYNNHIITKFSSITIIPFINENRNFSFLGSHWQNEILPAAIFLINTPLPNFGMKKSEEERKTKCEGTKRREELKYESRDSTEGKKQEETWRILKKIVVSMVVRASHGKNREIGNQSQLWSAIAKERGRTFEREFPLILASSCRTYVTRYSSMFLVRVPGRDANSPRRQPSVLPETDEKRASERGCRVLDPSEQVSPRMANGIVDYTWNNL